jgi:hypothetical protein
VKVKVFTEDALTVPPAKKRDMPVERTATTSHVFPASLFWRPCRMTSRPAAMAGPDPWRRVGSGDWRQGQHDRAGHRRPVPSASYPVEASGARSSAPRVIATPR